MSNKEDIELVDNESLLDQLSSLENKLSTLMNKLKENNENKFELIDRNDLKTRISTITSSLIESNFSMIKKYLQSKSNAQMIPVQETCVRLLTLCVQHSFDLARKISSEFNYFNETKNWLEKFLLIKKSDLREMSLEFILSYLKYTQPPFNSQDNLILIKKILLKSDSKSPLTLINCIFAHISSDPKATLDFMFSQLLYGIVHNGNFSKTEKIRLFSDHTLSKISKLFDYEDETESADQVHQMVTQFYKSLFTSTKFGISFYDKNIGLNSDKNLNHLIFNQLISLDFNKVYRINNVAQLFMSTLKVCPDLIQRFVKVKLKQLGADNSSLMKFLRHFFSQQSNHVKSLQRYLQGNENEHFLLQLIVVTSIPVGVNFQKDLGQDKLDLLTACLNCVKEWKRLCQSETEWNESMRLIMDKCECFETKLNIELLSKHLPRFDQLSKNFDLITVYVGLFEQSLNLMDLEQTEMDLSVKFEMTDASSYLKFVQCVAEIKYRNNFEMVSDRLRPVLVNNVKELIANSDLIAQLVGFFQLVMRASDVVKFDGDLMYLALRQMQQSGVDKCTKLLQVILSQKKRNILLLDVTDEIGLDIFLSLVDSSFDIMFNASLLNANENIYQDKLNAVHQMVGTKVQFGDEKIKVKTSSQAFMCYMRGLLDLKTNDLNVKLFNLSIRTRLLIYLLGKILNKADGFDNEADFNAVITNLENNVQAVSELSQDTHLSQEQVVKLNFIMNTILTSETMIKGSFENDQLSQFVVKSFQLNIPLNMKNIIEIYVNEYLKSNSCESFILELDLTKSQFDLVLQKLLQNYDLTKTAIKIDKKIFKIFIKFLHKNKDNLIDSVGVKYLDKIGKFDGNIKNYMDAFRLILLAIKSKQELLNDQVISLLSDCHCFQPTLFDLQLKLINDENLGQLIKTNIQPELNGDTLNRSLSSDLKKLAEEYKYSLDQKDLEIFCKLKQLDPELKCLLFSRISKLSKSNDLEQKQAKISDFITLKIDESIINNSIRNFPIRRLLDERFDIFDSNIYDPVYLLPNLYDLLNFANVVDVLQFIQSKCLSYLLSSLSSHCAKLRMLAYGSLHRFVSHLENSRVYCKSIIVYLINLLRNSMDKQNQRLSNVISVFLAESVSIIIEPGEVLYKPLVSFFLLKPVLDLTNVPEFYKFFNSSSLDFREERKWIMNILVWGIRSSLEYRLYEKRFLYRQILSIYDSKISDFELKNLILDLLIKTCESKYALIDLIKKQFFIIWLSSVLNSLVVDETKIDLFLKMIKMYNLIWSQLSIGKRDDRLPIGFLNQMMTFGKSIKCKLSESKVRFENLFKMESGDNEQKILLENFFKNSDNVVSEIGKYQIEVWQEQSIGEIIEKAMDKVQASEFNEYGEFVEFVLSRKRKIENFQISVEYKKHKI